MTMGWLSLATRIVPKVWRAGTKATSSLWRGGSAVLGTSGKVLSVAAKNPKTTVAAGVASFAGWRMLDHPEESAGTAVGKTVRSGVDGSGDFLHDAVNGFTGEETVEEVKDTTTHVVNDLKETVAESKNVLGSLGNTLQELGSSIGNLLGSGINMISNLFANISNGRISGLGIGGLIAASYMMFGRTGLLGKISGALLATMLIGGTSRQQTQTVGQETNQQQSHEQHHMIRR